MDILLSYKNVTDKEEIEIVKKFAYIKTIKYGDFTQYTYSIATTKKGPTQFEDYIYSNYPLLVKVISRGFSIVAKKKNNVPSISNATVFFCGVSDILLYIL